MLRHLKQTLKAGSNIHRADGSPNVFLFSMPRSGSTWLMELIWSQPGFKYCDEPLNLRNSLVRKHLGLNDWPDLYNDNAIPALQQYFQGFCDGRLRFMNPNPVRRYYRPVTRRIVFKVIHGGENRINWCRDRFNGRIVYLIRHPIAVSLSRELYPRLQAFLNSDYRQHLTPEQIQYAQKVIDSGTRLEQGVLSWCLQNLVPLKQATEDWTIVSYEQMVVDPQPIVDDMACKLGLPRADRIARRLTVPSGVKAKSDRETQQILEEETTKNRARLVEKWRKRVDRTEERRLMEILKLFQLEIYTFDNPLPNEQFWINPQPSLTSRAG